MAIPCVDPVVRLKYRAYNKARAWFTAISPNRGRVNCRDIAVNCSLEQKDPRPGEKCFLYPSLRRGGEAHGNLTTCS